ncbi:hypothetical protein B0H19DRAFT_1251077 [Mycena capillaripes]|nr:hypothetical protein B0H19DRAFT_1251077 [Mycena capillaripes]
MLNSRTIIYRRSPSLRIFCENAAAENAKAKLVKRIRSLALAQLTPPAALSGYGRKTIAILARYQYSPLIAAKELIEKGGGSGYESPTQKEHVFSSSLSEHSMTFTAHSTQAETSPSVTYSLHCSFCGSSSPLARPSMKPRPAVTSKISQRRSEFARQLLLSAEMLDRPATALPPHPAFASLSSWAWATTHSASVHVHLLRSVNAPFLTPLFSLNLPRRRQYSPPRSSSLRAAPHMQLANRNDEEQGKLLGSVVISQGDVVPTSIRRCFPPAQRIEGKVALKARNCNDFASSFACTYGCFLLDFILCI